MSKTISRFLITWYFKKLKHCHSQEVAVTYISAILKTCQKTYAAEIKRRTLHEILLQCFRLGVEESSLVCKVLRYVHEGKVGGILPFLIDLARLPREHQNGQLEYFLHNASEARMTLQRKRLPDYCATIGNAEFSLIDFCFLSGFSGAFIALLQHGARFSVVAPAARSEIIDTGFVKVVFLLHEIVKALNGLDFIDWKTPQAIVKTATLPENVPKYCEMFKVLMRYVPNPLYTTYILAKFMNVWPLLIPEGRRMQMYFDSLFPGKEFGRNGPESLQHTCKIVIRKRLNQNWQLPVGIWRLELHHHLCEYLNLNED